VVIICLGLPPTAPFWVTLMTVAGTIALSIMAHLAYAQVFSTLAMGPRAALYSGHFRVFFPSSGLKLLLYLP
tara:strand:- start:638 stop:853 length:216 start_codon:yes stop_codon:yes gene_type:complete